MKLFTNILRFGWPFLRPYKARLILGVVLGVIFGLSNVTFVWATKTTFDRLDPEIHAKKLKEAADAKAKAALTPPTMSTRFKSLGSDFEASIDPWLPLTGRKMDGRQLFGGLLLLPLLVAFRGFTGYFSSYFMAWVSERAVNDMRQKVVAKFNQLSLDFYNRSTIGDLLTHLTGDIRILQFTLNLGFSDLIKEPITVIGLLSGLLWMDWKLTLFAGVFLPLCVLPVRILGKKMMRAAKGNIDAGVQASSQLVELINGMRVVKAFSLERYQEERFKELSQQMVHHSMKGVQAKELVNPLIETFSTIGLGVLIIYIFANNYTLPDIVSFLVGIVTMYTPIKKLGNLHVMFKQASVGVDRLQTVMNEQPSVREPEHPKPVAGFRSGITLEDISFSYGHTTVLDHLTLSVPRGHRLGIAGESGSGKSTLVNLLFRFYDVTSGAIKVDGLDVREVSASDLRHQMALVSQEIVLFDQTIAENIALGKLGATQAEIETAAKAANAHEFILQLPHGYATRAGERGVTLSGGQRQRIAIARAFIRNAPILVLDEATASLDSQSESEVQAAIDKLAENRTVICIAHRLATLRSMDQIIVLTRGKIVEQGTFDELVRKGGAFSEMARKQGLGA